jgi:DNA-binding MarR family transcriptional regulator
MMTGRDPQLESREALIEEALERIDALAAHRRRAMCEQPLHREVSLPQLHVLMLLQERGRMMVSELAGLLRISMPSASSIVDRIEENGLVERTRDAADRRVVYVEITDRGRALAEDLMGLKRETMQRLFGAMTDEELGDMVRGMAALERALGRMHGEEQQAAS